MVEGSPFFSSELLVREAQFHKLRRVYGLEFKVRVWGSGFRVQGSGFRVQGLGFRV